MELFPPFLLVFSEHTLLPGTYLNFFQLSFPIGHYIFLMLWRQ
jgi:hypothetical protein